MEVGMEPTIKPTLADRVSELETDKKVATGQFRIILTMGILFWGAASTAVYEKLDSVSEALSRIPVLEQDVNLLKYQQGRQELLNDSVVSAQERIRADIEARYSRLTDRLNTIQQEN